MKHIEIWFITLIIVVLFILGILLFEILKSVVNPLAFIVSLIIIFGALIMLILRTILKD